jgi:predicted RNase H-like HicB family nuclease
MKRLPPASVFNLKVEFTRGVDGLWIAKMPALPGVTVQERTRKQALAAIEALASQILVDRIDPGESVPQ